MNDNSSILYTQNDTTNQVTNIHDQEYEERQKLMNQRTNVYNKVIRLDGKKNPNNPREELNKCKEVFVSKKANYVDCISCYTSIGENKYKIYKYKHPKNKQNEESK